MALLILTTLLTFLSLTTAHFHVTYPYWRGDSFATDKSQWIFPCANVSETTNRTSWSPTGGSLIFAGSHPWALTYVNMAFGNNVSSFNVTLLDHFNQTGNGTFCLKSIGGDMLAKGLASAGLDAKSAEGTNASIQVIQISSTGASLYNCADITFNASAALLGDDECRNATGVSGVAVSNTNAQTANATTSGSATGASSTGAAVALGPSMGGVLALAGMMAFGLA